MNNKMFKKFGSILLVLFIGVSVFSLFPTVTKAETANVTWSDGPLTKTIPQWNQTDIANVGKNSGKWYWEIKLESGFGEVGLFSPDTKQPIRYEGYSGSNYGPPNSSTNAGL